MVKFCYALSPGLSIDYSGDKDLGAVIEKFRQFLEIGVSCFGLFLDDIPEKLQSESDQERFQSLGEAHRAFTERVYRGLRELDSEASLIFCPTEYHGIESTAYHSEISKLPGDIMVFWTGPRICSREIRSQDAEKMAGAFGRKLLIWDNYPVNDYDRRSLHLNAVRDRDPGLPKHCVGLLTNPMSEAEASKVAIFTYGEYLWNPGEYDPEISLDRALTYLFGIDALPLARTLSESLVDFFFDPDERTRWVQDAISGGDDLDLELLLHRFDEIARTSDLLCTLENEQLVDEIETHVKKVADIGALGKLYIQRELLRRKIGRNRSRVFSEGLLDRLLS
jgi:hyaluronoglucosaminidase